MEWYYKVLGWGLVAGSVVGAGVYGIKLWVDQIDRDDEISLENLRKQRSGESLEDTKTIEG